MPAGGLGLPFVLLVAAVAVGLPLGLYLLVRKEAERNRTAMDRTDAERVARRDADERR